MLCRGHRAGRYLNKTVKIMCRPRRGAPTCMAAYAAPAQKLGQHRVIECQCRRRQRRGRADAKADRTATRCSIAPATVINHTLYAKPASTR